jgi:peptidase M28-like protein
MRLPRRVMTTLAPSLLICAMLSAQAKDTTDYAALARIRDEGLNRSQVMDHIGWLTDVYGPRLTGSPAIQQAADWAMKRMTEWGLVNVHQERWPFGKGWSLVHFDAHLIEPQVQPIIGYPGSWTPGTNGAVTADVVRVQIDSDADFDKYRGKLAGKIVLMQPAREVKMLDGRLVLRMNEDDIREAEAMPIPEPSAGRGGGRGGQGMQQRIEQFLKAEGVIARFDRGSDSFMSAGDSDLSWQTQRTDGGTIFPGGGGSRDATAGQGLPSVTIAVEHYNRMVRLLDRNIPVKVALNVQTKFYDETTMNGFNVIAEIAGTDLRQEVVMLGGHFDSVAAATGATDNACGSAIMMEAVRLIQASGLKPRRLLQRGQRDGADPRHLDAEQPRRAPDLRGVDQAARRSRRHDPRAAIGDQHRSLVVRCGRSAGVSVRAGAPRVQLAHAPLEHGLLRSRPARGHDPGGDRRRRVRVRRGDARREAAAQAAAGGERTRDGAVARRRRHGWLVSVFFFVSPFRWPSYHLRMRCSKSTASLAVFGGRCAPFTYRTHSTSLPRRRSA